jgi:hypothetical protein
MLRIVGRQRAESADQEFLLMQNQGAMRVTLRGHAVISESSLLHGDIGLASHAFSDEIQVPAGQYVILFSGTGISRWARTKDGHMIYHVYIGRKSPVWSTATLPIHLLTPQHSYTERPEPTLLLR